MKAAQIYQREGVVGVKQAFRRMRYSKDAVLDRNNYLEWVARYDTISDELRESLLRKQADLAQRPLISVVMPTYNPDPKWLAAAIGSVQKQIYPHWELCIADDASTDPTIRPLLEQYAKMDSRIKVRFREQNGHISASSNTALELTTGQWIALLDHDDQLTEHALFWVVDALNRNDKIRLIYSDEDKINEKGERFQPYFKSDWNQDLLYSHNLVTHLGVYSAELVKEIGGFRIGLEGAQDHDLVLRYIEHIQPEQIYHIPKILYHWRVHPMSTAQSSDAKPYAAIAGERALNEHFERRNINATAVAVPHGYRTQHHLPANFPLVSLIIPTRNSVGLLKQCVDSILDKTTYRNFEIIIVDNGSDDVSTLNYLTSLCEVDNIRVIRDDRPFNYSALNNSAVSHASGYIIGLLNNDLEVISPEWLSEMVSHALRPDIGAVGARLWYPDNTLQHGGVITGLGGVAGHAHKHLSHYSSGYINRAALIQNFSAVTAACLIIRKSIYEQVGGLNETELSVAFNDVDFCLRVREAGYRNIWTPYAELYHHESATRGYDDTPEKQMRFAKEIVYMKRQWGAQLVNDPAYSPNLTLDYEDFSLAWPPRIDALTDRPFQPHRDQCQQRNG